MNQATNSLSDIPLIAYGTWVENFKDAPSIVNRVSPKDAKHELVRV